MAGEEVMNEPLFVSVGSPAEHRIGERRTLAIAYPMCAGVMFVGFPLRMVSLCVCVCVCFFLIRPHLSKAVLSA